MRRLKINSKFDVIEPGLFLVAALLLIDCSFLLYQCTTIIAKVVTVLLAVYLCGLVIVKYRKLVFVLLLLLTSFLLANWFTARPSSLSLTKNSVIKLYPDETKLSEDWLSGQGTLNGKKVLVTAKLSQKQIWQAKQGKTIWLSDLQGEINSIEPATNYGQFDAQKYYATKKIWQKVNLKACRISFKRTGLIDYLHHLRYQLQRYFQRMPQILGFFSSELILGENPNSANQIILNNYRDLGIIHILSISGLHVGIYTIVITAICSFLKMTEKESFVSCLLVLVIGIFLSKGQAGFIRASLTFVLKQIFKFKKIPIAQYDILGLACIIHLLFDPRLMSGVGALLSYVLALGLEMTNKMSSIKQSIALNALLLPLLLFYFFQFNFLTVIFNIFAVPYFNWIVMPLTFLNLFIFAKLPTISGFFEFILETGEKMIGQISTTQLGLLSFGKINWWQCGGLLLVTGGIIVCLNDGVLLKKIKFIGGLGLLYGLLFCTIHFPLTGQVSFIDVGQGDSILITTPFPRKVYLIDVGGKLNFGKRKFTPQVNKITLPLLKALGINQIDGIFVTHQDADHVGDLGPLLSQIKVKKLYMAAGLIKNPSFAKRIAGHLTTDQLVELIAGDQVIEPQISFNVVYPFKPGPGKNEDSLSLTFKLKNKRWLFTGDLGQEGEKEIMANFHLRANYFKLGHHGSKTASNPIFLKQLQPEMVFISAGRNNQFGHPHPETIATLRMQHIPYASTQDCGMITWTYSRFASSKFSSFLPVKAK
ncbi:MULTISPECIES: DNA internalization-related competence protein ComEC/Rec2 [unclassified Lactobacillus]|uniref:DNA internalization-related competence protein ComEC/Rec2 n=1 Tax=unclassified Lactobacillus TaxID=2620435 RepID=UPI00226A1294|nr:MULTISPECIES: DNA internalization-related competence protein ComEC/Rec2 [unclassified Lactobacillus]MCX8721154.1 DNA internalization-related competence protein ComEC/Rec2 [Lactobacillus sp. B4010]MCX8732018.1 DNA internalization-related competence protein ComEC/Rec2 [Lactobacillus sp. B4015]MCX8734295.1 DNA internalization-related competence protein ComEC/Rec2 [Lactobacillus sp. B4012]